MQATGCRVSGVRASLDVEVGSDKNSTSKGSLTSPVGRRCPPRLEPWEGFLEEQRAILGEVFSALADIRAFRSRHYLGARGEVIGKKRAGDEDTLKDIMKDLIAEPVESIIGRLHGVDIGFNVRGGITFENSVNAPRVRGRDGPSREKGPMPFSTTAVTPLPRSLGESYRLSLPCTIRGCQDILSTLPRSSESPHKEMPSFYMRGMCN